MDELDSLSTSHQVAPNENSVQSGTKSGTRFDARILSVSWTVLRQLATDREAVLSDASLRPQKILETGITGPLDAFHGLGDSGGQLLLGNLVCC